MTSERKRAASRRNAQKSTGPKTAAGKANSRANALKHGLTGAGTVLPPEDGTLFQQRLHGFAADARPEGQTEGYLVVSMALASVRLDRCAREEFTEIARRRQEAIDGWESQQARKAKRLADPLQDDPEETVASLQEFARGCDWLLARWDDLGEALAEAGTWDDAQTDQAIRLLGKEPADDDAQAAELRAFVAASRPQESADDAAIATARSRLIGLAQQEVDRLEELRQELWNKGDGLALAETINLATFDDSPKGALRHRYQTAAASALHKAIDQLAKERKQAASKSARHGQEFDLRTLPHIYLGGQWLGGNVEAPEPHPPQPPTVEPQDAEPMEEPSETIAPPPQVTIAPPPQEALAAPQSVVVSLTPEPAIEPLPVVRNEATAASEEPQKRDPVQAESSPVTPEPSSGSVDVIHPPATQETAANPAQPPPPQPPQPPAATPDAWWAEARRLGQAI
ncbi:MAG TPA: hypothetical protein VGZ22_11780 [Isosphaeraceae bacterium]|nr:hypothetical protein [Isosphaeraceae bacterium]